MSDTSGRRLSFIVCFVIFIVADIGLALQTNYAALLILRMVQAAGASASISLAIAVVADIATSAERGKFMGYATAGILFGPAFGPTIGGVLVQYLGWRSVFWFLAIYAGVLLVLFALLFPETCRKVVGNGSIPAKGINQSLVSYLQRRNLSKNSPNPQPQDIQPKKTKVNWSSLNPLLTLRILAEKESCIVLLYNGFFFTGMMVTSTSVPSLYKHFYALDELQIGLCYISLGAGSLTSALTAGHITDWNFRRHATRLNIPITKGKQQDLRTFPIEVARLQVATPGHFIGTAGLLIFGWTIHFGTHLAVPEIALFLIGFGVSTAFSGTNTLLIDLHRDRPATATAAVNFVRCLMSAGGCAAIVPMWRSWGPGWAYTFIAGLYVGLYGVVVWVMRRGMRWRGELEERKARKGRDADIQANV
jgi:multidrug resistance protein